MSQASLSLESMTSPPTGQEWWWPSPPPPPPPQYTLERKYAKYSKTIYSILTWVSYIAWLHLKLKWSSEEVYTISLFKKRHFLRISYVRRPKFWCFEYFFIKIHGTAFLNKSKYFGWQGGASSRRRRNQRTIDGFENRIHFGQPQDILQWQSVQKFCSALLPIPSQNAKKDVISLSIRCRSLALAKWILFRLSSLAK